MTSATKCPDCGGIKPQDDGSILCTSNDMGIHVCRCKCLKCEYYKRGDICLSKCHNCIWNFKQNNYKEAPSHA